VRDMTRALAQNSLSALYPQEKSLTKKAQNARERWLKLGKNLGHAPKKHEFEAQDVAAKDLQKVSWELAGVRAEIDYLTPWLRKNP
jgi:hypothetical protein